MILTEYIFRLLCRNHQLLFKGTRLFGLADSVTGHFRRDISAHKELMKVVKFVNENEYLGRIII